MKNEEFIRIKQNAIDENIPIIMDDTLEYLDSIFKNSNIENILEIGTAVRLFCHLFFQILIKNREDRYYWKRRYKS